MKCFKFLSTVVAVAVIAVSGYAEVPRLINYQGRLTTTAGVPVANATYSVGFSIYDTPTDALYRWHEDVIVTTISGLFAVLLGNNVALPAALFSDTTRYIGIKVSTDLELIPRQRLASVPYSFRVGTVDGATGGTISGNTSFQSDLTVSGNVGVGTTSPSSKLDVVGDLKVSGNIIGSTPWTAFPFAGGYNNMEDAHGGGYQRAQYRKIGDMVYLRGVLHKADHGVIPNGAILGTLPVGFRPPAIVSFAAAGGTTYVSIFSSGDVISYTSPSERQYLDGFNFSTSP